MKVYFLTCFVAMFMFNGSIAIAQTSCEENSSYLDVILSKAKEDDLVIVIAKLGAKEQNVNLNKRRLHNVKAYLTEYRKGLVFLKHPKNIVLATGEKTDGLGALEIYFQGKLFATFSLFHNEDLYVGECAIDLEFVKSPCDINEQKVFYPCLDKKRK